MAISIIIPTLNEERCLGETLRGLRQQQPAQIIVVDGGSSDATCQVAQAADLLLHGPCGRAAQMNLGADHASGDVLLFLHADCTLEDGALHDAERLLAGRGIVGGCFTMAVQASGLFYRTIDACATARVRLTRIVYGDQGLFLHRKRFQQLGGFPRLRLMEDLFFSRTLRRQGRLVVSTRRIYVSPRRWQRTGLVRQTLRNWTLTGLAASGVSPNVLARFYPIVR